MPLLEPSLVSWLLCFIQAFGVAATIMVRLHHGTDDERSYQNQFLVGLVLVALVTFAQFALRTSSCVASGFLLALMVLGVTIDFSEHTTRAAGGLSRNGSSG